MSASVTPWSVCDHPTKLSSENTLLAPAPANTLLHPEKSFNASIDQFIAPK